ncbi:unnamed protein product [Leptidea sinapis]|uniref:Uncharacterized protein n=1 Tax=Leptidea sinapis TaxID=189913 RepID=A0A5E4PN49_9NEOP|nr:unnamed protein product [Leptidea sinapis]
MFNIGIIVLRKPLPNIETIEHGGSGMRVYKRKSQRATQSQEVYELAAAEVLEKQCSIRKANLLGSVPEVDISTTEIISLIETANEPTPSCSGLQKTFSPSKIRPLPKAPPRKTNTNSRLLFEYFLPARKLANGLRAANNFRNIGMSHSPLVFCNQEDKCDCVYIIPKFITIISITHNILIWMNKYRKSAIFPFYFIKCCLWFNL